MDRADYDALLAALSEVSSLADSARRCLEHTRYVSSDPVAMTKYHRTPTDVGVWIDRMRAATARVEAARRRVPSMAAAERTA